MLTLHIFIFSAWFGLDKYDIVHLAKIATGKLKYKKNSGVQSLIGCKILLI